MVTGTTESVERLVEIVEAILQNVPSPEKEKLVCSIFEMHMAASMLRTASHRSAYQVGYHEGCEDGKKDRQEPSGPIPCWKPDRSVPQPPSAQRNERRTKMDTKADRTDITEHTRYYVYGESIGPGGAYRLMRAHGGVCTPESAKWARSTRPELDVVPLDGSDQHGRYAMEYTPALASILEGLKSTGVIAWQKIGARE